MRINYDPQSDVMYIRFSEEKYFESDEIKDGVILDYDKKGKILALELLDVSKRLPQTTMDSLHFEISR